MNIPAAFSDEWKKEVIKIGKPDIIDMAARLGTQLAAAQARIAALEAALKDALELAADGVSYTPDYFRDKWGMDDELKRLREIAAALLAPAPDAQP